MRGSRAIQYIISWHNYFFEYESRVDFGSGSALVEGHVYDGYIAASRLVVDVGWKTIKQVRLSGPVGYMN